MLLVPCPLRCIFCLSKILMTLLSIRANFFKDACSDLLNKLSSSLQSCANLAQFKAQLSQLTDVPMVINLTHDNNGLDEAYKTVLELCFMTESSLRSPPRILRIQLHFSLPFFLALSS